MYTRRLGRYDEAIAAFEKIRELMPKAGDFIRAGIARVYALMGREREARQMISGVKANPYWYCRCLRGARRQG